MRQLFDPNLRVFVYNKPIDMRKSYDSLFQLVRQEGIFKGGLFVFVSNNRKRAKVLLWNKVGLMIIMQRMEHGRLADIMRRQTLTRDELLDFFEGDKTIRKIEID